MVHVAIAGYAFAVQDLLCCMSDEQVDKPDCLKSVASDIGNKRKEYACSCVMTAHCSAWTKTVYSKITLPPSLVDQPVSGASSRQDIFKDD